MSIGKMNRRPLFFNETTYQDAGGGSKNLRTVEWYQWAQVDDRTGSSFDSQSTDLQRYDYRVRVRADSRFGSQTKMVYDGNTCKPESLTIESEGYKQFFVLRYSKIET